MRQKRKTNRESLAVKGFFRVQVVEKKTGKVIGDSGATENQITNYGMQLGFVGAVFGLANSVQAGGMILGSGSVPASGATSLPLALTKWYSTYGTALNASTQMRMTQTFSLTDAATVGNIGLMPGATYNATNSLLCGNTYASSAVATTQTVNVTYDLNYTRA